MSIPGVRDDGSVVPRVLALWLLIGLAACSSHDSVQPASLRQGTVVFGGDDRLHVRIAETQAEREAGLMHVMALAPDDVSDMFQASVVYEQLRDRKLALQWIVKAIKGGFSRDLIEKEPTLTQLRLDPRFQSLLGP